MTFLLILIFVIFILPSLLARLGKWYLRYKTRQFFNRMNGATAGAGAHRTNNPGSHAAPKKRKKIEGDVGEYVEFEEITETTFTSRTDDVPPATSGVAEEQIADAEWEDVK